MAHQPACCRYVEAFKEGLKKGLTIDRSLTWKDRTKGMVGPLSFWMNASLATAITTAFLHHVTYGSLPDTADACAGWDYEEQRVGVETLSGLFGASFYLQWREYGYQNVPCAPFQQDIERLPAPENIYELWRT